MPLPVDYLKQKLSQRGVALLRTAIVKESWVDPIVGDPNGILEALLGPDTTTLTLSGASLDGIIGVSSFDFPRTVIVTVTHASAIVASNGVITGKDADGNIITETWAVTATGVSKTDETAQAFASVEEVTIIAAADATGNTNIVGTANVFGLKGLCAAPSFVEELEDSATPTAGVVVAASVAANADRKGTYAPDSTPNGALDFELWYLVDDPAGS